MDHVTRFVALLLLAIIVALACKRYALPYTTALVACGLLLGPVDSMPLSVERDFLLFAFLPPLLFQGALDMDLELLRAQWFPVLLYSVAGTILSGLVIGGIVWTLVPGALGAGASFTTALFLGTILSATDPVSVLATFRQYAVDKRLATLLEGESVFNDGVAVILYLVLYDAVRLRGVAPSVLEVALRLVAVTGGAVVIGVASGWFVYRVVKQIDDHLLEVMTSVVLAWGAYLLAERLHTSGVLASACAGLIIGNYGRLFSMSPAARVTLSAFWEVAAFIANSFVFIMIGVQLNRAGLSAHLPLMAVTIGAMLASRAVVVFALAPVCRAAGWPLPTPWLHALNVGGLRGSIPVALALGLGTDVPGHDALVAAILGAVSFSLLVQALAVRPVLARLGLLPMVAAQLALEVQTARELGLKAALAELAAMEGLAPSLRAALESELRVTLDGLRREGERLRDARHGTPPQEAGCRARLLHARRAAVEEAFRRGLISFQAFEEARLEIDLAVQELGGER